MEIQDSGSNTDRLHHKSNVRYSLKYPADLDCCTQVLKDFY